jgi:hypothetical protein
VPDPSSSLEESGEPNPQDFLITTIDPEPTALHFLLDDKRMFLDKE